MPNETANTKKEISKINKYFIQQSTLTRAIIQIIQHDPGRADGRDTHKMSHASDKRPLTYFMRVKNCVKSPIDT